MAQGPFLPLEEAQRVGAMVGRTFREVLAPSDPELADSGPRAGPPDAGADADARTPAVVLPTVTRGPAPPLPRA